MPDVPAPEANENHKLESNGSSKPPPVTVRELTQTDQLNKKLLQSLLDRMNQGDACLASMMTKNEDDENPDDWDSKS